MEQYYMDLLSEQDDDGGDSMYDTIKDDLEANVAQQKAAAESVYGEQQRYLGDLEEEQRIANRNWQMDQEQMRAQMDEQRMAQMGDTGTGYWDPTSESGRELTSDIAEMAQQDRQASEADYMYGQGLMDSDLMGIARQVSAMQRPRTIAGIESAGADRLQELQMQQLQSAQEADQSMREMALRGLGERDLARAKGELVGSAGAGVLEPQKRMPYIQDIIGSKSELDLHPSVKASFGIPAEITGIDEDPSWEAAFEQIMDMFLQTGNTQAIAQYLIPTGVTVQ